MKPLATLVEFNFIAPYMCLKRCLIFIFRELHPTIKRIGILRRCGFCYIGGVRNAAVISCNIAPHHRTVIIVKSVHMPFNGFVSIKGVQVLVISVYHFFQIDQP